MWKESCDDGELREIRDNLQLCNSATIGYRVVHCPAYETAVSIKPTMLVSRSNRRVLLARTMLAEGGVARVVERCTLPSPTLRT